MTPALEAALRLYAQASAQGKVRTHQQEEGPRKGDAFRGKTLAEITAGKRRHVRTGKGRGGGNARAVIIGKRTYPTVRAATRDNKISTITLYDWLDSGKARYADK